MATGLNYDELKDHPIEETYKQWAKQYFIDPSSVSPYQMHGVDQINENPAFALNLFFQDEGVQAANEQAAAAQQAAQDAYRQTFAAQRAARAKQRAIARKRMQFKLDTGLRDIEKGRERGLENVVNDALQRGLYRSGIRIENEATVNEDSDDAASDLRKQIDLALKEIAASAAAEGANARAQDAAFAAEDAMGLAQGLQQGAIDSATQWWQAQQEAAAQRQLDQPGTATPPPPTGGLLGPLKEPELDFTSMYPQIPSPQFKIPQAQQPGPLYPQIPEPSVRPVGSTQSPRTPSASPPAGGGRYY